jgi:hypothetical protein
VLATYSCATIYVANLPADVTPCGALPNLVDEIIELFVSPDSDFEEGQVEAPLTQEVNAPRLQVNGSYRS